MTIYNAVSANKRKTIFIMVLFIAFFLTVSYILGKALGYGWSFAGIMLIISGISTFISYYYSDQIVLSMSGAKPASHDEYKQLYHTVENLSIADGNPMPKVYVMEDPAPNAFATGRDPQHAAVCVTTGLLEKLKNVELEGVIAHELSHIKNYDTRLMGVVAILVGAIAILSDVFLRNLWYGGLDDRNERNQNPVIIGLAILFAILSPIIATLMQLALSRKREYLADADGALLTRYPEGLASALEIIAQDKNPVKHASLATAHFYIENPFKSERRRSWLANLFSTHPPIEDRVKILRAM